MPSSHVILDAGFHLPTIEWRHPPPLLPPLAGRSIAHLEYEQVVQRLRHVGVRSSETVAHTVTVLVPPTAMVKALVAKRAELEHERRECILARCSASGLAGASDGQRCSGCDRPHGSARAQTILCRVESPIAWHCRGSVCGSEPLRLVSSLHGCRSELVHCRCLSNPPAGIHKFVPEHHVHSNRAAETAVVNAQRPRWNLSPKPEAPLPGGGAFASPADVNWGALIALSAPASAHISSH